MYQDIVERMKFASQSPHALSGLRIELAGEYESRNGELADILARKPAIWNEIRKHREIKSDTAAERVWQSTAEGLKETELRLRLKSIEKLNSAMKTQIDLLQGEKFHL